MRRGLTARMVLASGVLLLALAGAFTVLLLAVSDLRATAREARGSEQVLASANRFERLVVDLETGVRGYVITRRSHFLEPWQAARRALPAQEANLERVSARHQEQVSTVVAITRAVNSYIADYAKPLIAAARRGSPAARSVAATAEGERRIDAIRVQFDRLIDTERHFAAQRQERADDAARRAVLAAAVGLALSILLVLLFCGYLTRAVIRPVRRAARMAGRLAGGDLSTRMPATGVGEIGQLERAFNEMAGSLERNRDDLAGLAAEQAALRRVATLVARRAAPPEVFSAVANEMADRLGVEVATVLRYEPDGTATVVGAWSERGMHVPIGTRLALEPDGIAASVLQAHRPARADRFEGQAGSVETSFRALGIRSAVGSPITVEDTLWGVAIAASTGADALPAGSEERIAEFTELVATAIANAESRAELAASRARVVAAGDETRRRLERDLHDGAQQRLVSLALRLRAAAAAIPSQLKDAHAELARVGADLDEVLEDLREISRGIHPAILSQGGLAAALRALARRSAVPVELEIHAPPRLPERVEVAAYYVIAEALTNVAKHSKASVVDVDVDAQDGLVRLAVRDDGVGGADPARGSGLIGLKDRVEATGGTMMLESRPGRGTRLVVELPLDAGVATDSR